MKSLKTWNQFKLSTAMPKLEFSSWKGYPTITLENDAAAFQATLLTISNINRQVTISLHKYFKKCRTAVLCYSNLARKLLEDKPTLDFNFYATALSKYQWWNT